VVGAAIVCWKSHTLEMLFGVPIKPLKWQEVAMRMNDGCRPMLRACNSQMPMVVLNSNCSNGMKLRASTMLRSAALRFTAEGRLLGFDTGDWSMLLGGFLVAGLLTLMI